MKINYCFIRYKEKYDGTFEPVIKEVPFEYSLISKKHNTTDTCHLHYYHTK